MYIASQAACFHTNIHWYWLLLCQLCFLGGCFLHGGRVMSWPMPDYREIGIILVEARKYVSLKK